MPNKEPAGVKLEMPELAINEELAMEEREGEEDKSFLAADNGEMAQMENGQEQGQDKSVWRDLEQFWPMGDRAKVEEIRSLYGVSGSYASCKPNRNLIYLQCSSRKYKCSYILRWRKADGMVQAKGEHNHKNFGLPRKLRQEPSKCRECLFESGDSEAMRQHYGQIHPEKTYFHCAHCPINFTLSTNLRRHERMFHSEANQQVKEKAIEVQLEGGQKVGDEQEDELEDLKGIFANAIEDELSKERQKQAAAAAEAGAVGCSSRVYQRLDNPPPLLMNPMIGFEEAMIRWESRYKNFNATAQFEDGSEGTSMEWLEGGGGSPTDSNGTDSQKRQGIPHIFNKYI